MTRPHTEAIIPEAPLRWYTVEHASGASIALKSGNADAAIVKRLGQIIAAAKRRGRQLVPVDALPIAATETDGDTVTLNDLYRELL